MKPEVKKWRLVGGQVYRLADIFGDCLNAMKHAQSLKIEKHVILTRIASGCWAVYWRARENEPECPPELYRIS